MNKDYGSNSYCENCGSLKTEKYGSGRFCSESCARSFSTKNCRKEVNNKISNSLKKGYASGKISHKRNSVCAMAKKNHEEHLKRKVKISKNVILDITYGELEKYREEHPACEICGRTERSNTRPKNNKFEGMKNNLARDHDHTSNKFRGLLCMQCNIGLGWYEKYKNEIEKYLNKSA